MPSVSIDPPTNKPRDGSLPNPLPQLLQTPSGLAILEVQGTIHIPPVATSDGDMNLVPDTQVGHLIVPDYNAANLNDTAWMKLVYLYIGKNQRLTGQVKKLPNAIGVLRRRESGGETLEIAEIIKHKIVFSSRPEPVTEAEIVAEE
jgi:hypothetical protein